MFHDLRTRVSRGRRLAAWGLLGLLLAGGAVTLLVRGMDPRVKAGATVFLWVAGAWLGVKAFAFVLLDPLLSRRRNAAPGFARETAAYS